MAEKENKTKGINLAIQETRQNMVAIMNSSGLPPACLMLILGELTSVVSALNEQCVKSESEEFYNEKETKPEEREG